MGSSLLEQEREVWRCCGMFGCEGSEDGRTPEGPAPGPRLTRPYRSAPASVPARCSWVPSGTVGTGVRCLGESPLWSLFLPVTYRTTEAPLGEHLSGHGKESQCLDSSFHRERYARLYSRSFPAAGRGVLMRVGDKATDITVDDRWSHLKVGILCG